MHDIPEGYETFKVRLYNRMAAEGQQHVTVTIIARSEQEAQRIAGEKFGNIYVEAVFYPGEENDPLIWINMNCPIHSPAKDYGPITRTPLIDPFMTRYTD